MADPKIFRRRFCDPLLVERDIALLDKHAPFHFMPIDVVEENIAWKYTPFIFGIMPSGLKICVVVRGVFPFIDVHTTDKSNLAQVRDFLSKSQTFNGTTKKREFGRFSKNEIFLRPTQLGFHPNSIPFTRIEFDTIFDRKEAVTKLQGEGNSRILLSHDDTGSSYFQVMARDARINTSSWNIVSNYGNISLSCYENDIVISAGDHSQHCFRIVELAKFDANTFSAVPLTEFVTSKVPAIVEAWDTEVSSTDGKLPKAGENVLHVPALSLAYSWRDDPKPFLNIVLSLYDCVPFTEDIEEKHQLMPINEVPSGEVAPEIPTEPIEDEEETTEAAEAAEEVAEEDDAVAAAEDFHHPLEDAKRGVDFSQVRGDLTRIIICKNDAEAVKVRALLARLMSPDFRIGFNSGGFDWSIMRSIAVRYSLQEDIRDMGAIKRKVIISGGKSRKIAPNAAEDKFGYRLFNDAKIKISASSPEREVVQVRLPGCVDVDVQIVFMRAFPAAEVGFGASLAFYLAQLKLKTKEDISFNKMFQAWRRAELIAKYRINGQCHCSDRKMQSSCQLCADFDKLLDCEMPPGAKLKDDARTDKILPIVTSHKCCAGKFAQNLKDISEINYYNLIDSVRLQQMMIKKTVWNDMAEIANAAFVPIIDSFYRAGGMKVKNLLAAMAYRFGYALSLERKPTSEDMKTFYPGAYIFPPVGGITDVPVFDLDFKSLYPNLDLEFNISWETIVESEEEANRLRKLGYSLHEIKFDYFVGKKKDDPKNERRSCHAYSVQHNNVRDIFEPNTANPPIVKLKIDPSLSNSEESSFRTRRALPGEHLGLLGYAINEVLNLRKGPNAEKGKLSKILEEMEANKEEMVTYGNRRMTKAELQMFYDCLNARQNALKIIANTFYGTTGDRSSPLFKLEIAGGITSAGQWNIRRVADFAMKRGYTIMYGDTDSIFMKNPPEIYASASAEYHERLKQIEYPADGSETRAIEEKRHAAYMRYAEAMIMASIEDAPKLNDAITQFLRKERGWSFLIMEYEKSCFPAAFFGKKKYCVKMHEKQIAWQKKPLIKGLELIKQGQSVGTQLACSSIIAAILEPTEKPKNLTAIVCNTAHEFASGDLSAKAVKQFARYREAKKNIPVKTFVARMRERFGDLQRRGDPSAPLYEPPEDGDKFEYVVVKTPLFDGASKNAGKKGDKMEYYRAFEEQAHAVGWEIDRDHYIKLAIGQFARFIAYSPEITAANPSTGLDLTINKVFTTYDRKLVEAAKKFIIAHLSGKSRIIAPRFTSAIAKEVRNELLARIRDLIFSSPDATKFILGAIVDLLNVASANENLTQAAHRVYEMYAKTGKVIGEIPSEFARGCALQRQAYTKEASNQHSRAGNDVFLGEWELAPISIRIKRDFRADKVREDAETEVINARNKLDAHIGIFNFARNAIDACIRKCIDSGDSDAIIDAAIDKIRDEYLADLIEADKALHNYISKIYNLMRVEIFIAKAEEIKRLLRKSQESAVVEKYHF